MPPVPPVPPVFEARPQSGFNWDYAFFDGLRQVAELDQKWTREAARVEIESETFEFRRQGLMSGEFHLIDAAGEVLARARKPSAVKRRFEVTCGDEEFAVEPVSMLSSTMRIRRGRRTVGHVKRRRFWSRVARIDLPEDLPLPLRIFLIWLVLLSWRREAAAAAGGGGS